MKRIILLLLLHIVFANSFSQTTKWSMRLAPNPARVWIEGELPLNVIAEYKSGDRIKNTVFGTGWYLPSITPNKPEWTVNGIINGNNLVGQIIMTDEYSITFKAPLQKPLKNPVEVIATYKDAYLNGKNSKKKVISHIWIDENDDESSKNKSGDGSSKNNGGKNDQPVPPDSKDSVRAKGGAWEVKMESVVKAGSKWTWGGIRTFRDKGSFIVRLDGKEPKITDIKNNLETMTDDCKNILLNPTTCTGLLHVAGTKAIKVTPANPPGQPYPIVEIWFVPYPAELSRVQFDCPPPPGGTKGHSIGVEPAFPKNFSRALPYDIKFIAKDGEQIIIESPKDSEDGYLKIWVRKLKDD